MFCIPAEFRLSPAPPLPLPSGQPKHLQGQGWSWVPWQDSLGAKALSLAEAQPGKRGQEGKWNKAPNWGGGQGGAAWHNRSHPGGPRETCGTGGGKGGAVLGSLAVLGSWAQLSSYLHPEQPGSHRHGCPLLFLGPGPAGAQAANLGSSGLARWLVAVLWVGWGIWEPRGPPLRVGGPWHGFLLGQEGEGPAVGCCARGGGEPWQRDWPCGLGGANGFDC